MRVAFLHPDLGLGGAERLVVDLATGLTDKVRWLSGMLTKDGALPRIPR